MLCGQGDPGGLWDEETLMTQALEPLEPLGVGGQASGLWAYPPSPH